MPGPNPEEVTVRPWCHCPPELPTSMMSSVILVSAPMMSANIVTKKLRWLFICNAARALVDCCRLNPVMCRERSEPTQRGKINGAVRGAAGGNRNRLNLCCRLHVWAEWMTVETVILTNQWPAQRARRQVEPCVKQLIMWFNYLLFKRYANRVDATRWEMFASKAHFGHFRKIFLK